MTNLIDTHFHLDHYKNYLEVATRISELMQYTICVTNSPGVFLSCKRIIPETMYLRFAIGFHPLEHTLNTKDLNTFLCLLDRTNYVGEIGLDFSRASHMTRENQLHCFESILSRCASDNKLMTVHIRNAEEEAIRIIRKYAPKKCIIHWFTGTDEQMIKLLDLGCFMSVNSNMVVSNNKSKYLKIPTDRILIESDGPYTRVFGKRYTPDLLSQSYKLISEFYENSDLITIAYKNFKDVLKK